MRVALVSDVHGNLRALDACLDDLARQGGADAIVGAGDYCLDGPRPREVLERLAHVEASLVRGNTDRYIAEPTSDPDLDDEAEELAWQRKRLGDVWVQRLRDLPFSLRLGDGPGALLVVHGSPLRDDEHVWPDADDAFLERITAGVAERTIAFGHLHLPYVRLWRDRLLVNVASCGLPKDGDARACYAILTQRPSGWEVKHRRVPFDVDKVAREIHTSGMPNRKRRVRTLRRHRYEGLGERIP